MNLYLIETKSQCNQLNKFNDVYLIDGYSSYFLKNKIHLVNSFRKILGLEKQALVDLSGAQLDDAFNKTFGDMI